MQRLIVTGANGSGKSHLARRLGQLRPEVPVVSFDALKLTRNWVQRPREDIDRDLARAIAAPAWILEGGPSLLRTALPRAEAVIWLDPSEALRAWRLALRPWRSIGRTRPELPPGNADWPLTQYRFAWRSLRNGSRFRDGIAAQLKGADHLTVWRCHTAAQVSAAQAIWATASPPRP